jgi:hypothetical protein
MGEAIRVVRESDLRSKARSDDSVSVRLCSSTMDTNIARACAGRQTVVDHSFIGSGTETGRFTRGCVASDAHHDECTFK